MGIHVGITTMKLANKLSTKASARHSGRLAPVACEALEERWSTDPDVNKKLTARNEYEGIQSGMELGLELTREAQEYSDQRKLTGGRALRDTASIGFAAIVKPKQEDFAGLTPGAQRRFLLDSRDFLDQIFQSKRRASVIHWDEGTPHSHSFYDGFLPSGELCVDKLLNPRVWKRINTEYVGFMAERGWEVEPPELYDSEKAADDPEYLKERKEKRKQFGRNAERYKQEQRRKQAEQAEAEARERLQEASEREESIGTREKRVKLHEKAAESREKQISKREQELAAREAELTAKEKALQQREQANEKAIAAGRRALSIQAAAGMYTPEQGKGNEFSL